MNQTDNRQTNETQERFWLTIEDKAILSGLGMEDPARDPVTDSILDELEQLLATCKNKYMEQLLEQLLDRLELEL